MKNSQLETFDSDHSGPFGSSESDDDKLDASTEWRVQTPQRHECANLNHSRQTSKSMIIGNSSKRAVIYGNEY